MLCYGIDFFYIIKKEIINNKIKKLIIDNIPKNNYFALFFKGFLLNFINIGVLGFWL